MTAETVAIASDHAGFALKQSLKSEMEQAGVKVLDLGPDSTQSVDYPDFAEKMAAALKDGRATRGVLVCGTGIGIAMAANRFRHVRAAVCHDVSSARLARMHNNANVLAIGARLTGEQTAKDCLRTFLDTEFEGGRHERRVAKMS